MVEIFTPGAEPLANYNYSELSSSIGWINLQAVVGNAAGTKLITSMAWDSDPIYESANYANAVIFDHDYDMLIGKQICLYGKTQINVPTGTKALSGSGVWATTLNAAVTVTLRKVISGVESDIATATGTSKNYIVTWTGGDVVKFFNNIVILDIPNTILKKGDTLRLSIILTGTTASGGNEMRYYHDPRDVVLTSTDTTFANVYSCLKLPLPTKINM